MRKFRGIAQLVFPYATYIYGLVSNKFVFKPEKQMEFSAFINSISQFSPDLSYFEKYKNHRMLFLENLNGQRVVYNITGDYALDSRIIHEYAVKGIPLKKNKVLGVYEIYPNYFLRNKWYEYPSGVNLRIVPRRFSRKNNIVVLEMTQKKYQPFATEAEAKEFVRRIKACGCAK